MLDRFVGLARPTSQYAADVPGAGVIWIEREGTVNQSDHRTDVFAEIGQRVAGIRQDAWVLAGHFKGSPREIGALRTIRLRIFAATVQKQPDAACRSPGERGSVARIARDRLLQQAKCLRDLSRRGKEHGVRPQVRIIGAEIGGRAVGRAGGFGGLQRRLDDAGDAGRDLVLQLEDIFERTVEAVGPQMRPGQRVDQLRRDAHPSAGFAHRAFEHIADTELSADLLHLDRLAFVRKARIAGDHEEPADAGERGNDLLNHAVGEIFLLRVTAQIGEGQYRDRRLVRQWESGFEKALPLRQDAKNAHGARDVFERLLTDVLEGQIEPARGVFADPRRDADAARLGEAFETCRDVDAVAKEVAVFDDDVALVDADAEVDPAVGRQRIIAGRYGRLQLGRAAHRIDNARKLYEQPVAGSLDDAASVLSDPRVDGFGAQRLEPAESALFVGFDQPRIAGDIGREDRRETPGLAHPSQPALRRPSSIWAWSSGRIHGTRFLTYMSKEAGVIAI